MQEEFTTIAYDNTYYYNTSFSRQNTENFFSHLPADWNDQLCFTYYPFRVVYSNPQDQNADVRFNNWLVYSPLSLFDFPQNYGNLVSLDGIQNKAILARFENKTLLYNNLLTMNTSNPQAAYLGNPDIFSNTPIDYAETDLGYVGSQNKFLLKIPQGQVTIDAKRGQVFLIQGTKIEEIAGFGSGVNRFMTDHLSFEIQRYFPTHEETINGKTVLIPGVDIDNNFNGIGLHGVYDSKFERVIITKLDYIPIDKDVKYDPITREFYVETVYEIIQPSTTSTTTIFTPTTSTTSTTSTSTSTTTTTTTLYPVTTICEVEWAKVNLDVTKYRNGDTIPQANNQSELNTYALAGTGCWSYPNFNSSYGTTYGKLYNWYAVNDIRGLAPTGWHIPSNSELLTLNSCLGGDLNKAGGKLKEVGTAHWQSPNTDATDLFGFTALPSGLNLQTGTPPFPPSNVNFYTYFWQAEQFNISLGQAMSLEWNDGLIHYVTESKGTACSVRLIKD